MTPPKQELRYPKILKSFSTKDREFKPLSVHHFHEQASQLIATPPCNRSWQELVGAGCNDETLIELLHSTLICDREYSLSQREILRRQQAHLARLKKAATDFVSLLREWRRYSRSSGSISATHVCTSIDAVVTNLEDAVAEKASRHAQTITNEYLIVLIEYVRAATGRYFYPTLAEIISLMQASLGLPSSASPNALAKTRLRFIERYPRDHKFISGVARDFKRRKPDLPFEEFYEIQKRKAWAPLR